MRRHSFLAILLALILVGVGSEPPAGKSAGASRVAGPLKLTPPPSPVRGVQVLTLDCRDWDEVDQRLAEFKAGGVKVVIVRVFHNPGDRHYPFIRPAHPSGVYFQTSASPVVADALGPILKLAHRRGLKVVAWMTTRYADYGREDELELRAMSWDFEKKQTVPARGYCPLLPEVHDRLSAVYSDLARYPIDGVLIQDDLVYRHLEGMNPRARALYEQATGRKADPDLFFKQATKIGPGRYRVGQYTEEFHKWRRWQNAGLVLLAERLRNQVQAVRPGTPVGINIYYETVTAPDNAMTWFAQDMEALLQSNLDFYALMLYHRQMMSELNLSKNQVFALIERAVDALAVRADHQQRIWVKLQTVDWNSGARIPAAEVAELAARVEKIGPVGIILMPTPKSLDETALKEIFP